MPDPISLISEDGKFAEGWKEKFVPEDIRDADYWGMVTDFPQMVKQFDGLQRKLGKNKLAVPGEDATDADWNEFYSAVGKPKTPDDYKYKPAEGAPERDSVDLKKLREFAHKSHWTQKQFNDALAFDDQERITGMRDAETKETEELQSAEESLKKHYGMAYEERIHLSNVMLNKYADQDQTLDKQEFIAKYGRTPDVIKMMAWAGQSLKEHDVLVANLTQKAPKEAKAELDEIMSGDEYDKYIRGELARSAPMKHEQMKKRITELYRVIAPE